MNVATDAPPQKRLQNGWPSTPGSGREKPVPIGSMKTRLTTSSGL